MFKTTSKFKQIMKLDFKQIVIVILSGFLLSCNSDENSTPTTTTPPVVNPPVTTNPPIPSTINYLALGDSYTIGI